MDETSSAKADENEPTSPTSADVEQSPLVCRPLPSDKIIVLLRPAGSTPTLSKAKWSVPRDKTIGSIILFVKKILKMDSSKSLFVYVKQTFAPSADVEVGKLLDCFGSDGQLVLHYCLTEAWG
ncbi:ubiquitin-like protein ATG12 [Watersipora subatra]|uniref:ubiquitin-like protein ATG12 n=1 Tax=Watersipora subatra TaxID=2589382 RepID=UPI00355C9911